MLPPQEAIIACAADAGVATDELCVATAEEKGRNQLFTLVAEGARRDHAYFVKVRRDSHALQTWRVDLDFAGLRYVTMRGPFAPRVGCIKPVGYGTQPKWLASRYQDGRTLDRPILSAIRYGRNCSQARQYVTLIAQWMAGFRASGIRPRTTAFQDDVTGLKANFERLSLVTRRLADSVWGPIMEAITDDEEQFAAGLSAARPTHGDMGVQNFLEGTDGVIYPIDFSAFGFRALDTDCALFRIRLEKNAVLGFGPRRRANEMWRAFWDMYISAGQDPGACVFSYLYKVSTVLLKQVERAGSTGWLSPTRIRDHLWLRDRMRWLNDLPKDSTRWPSFVRDHL